MKKVECSYDLYLPTYHIVADSTDQSVVAVDPEGVPRNIQDDALIMEILNDNAACRFEIHELKVKLADAEKLAAHYLECAEGA